MEEKDKKKLYNKIAWRIFLALLIGFMALYISEATGYYEFEQHKRVTLTEEKIKEFEEDIAMGKNIDISDYIEERDISYQNNVSNLGNNLSNQIGNIVQNGIESTFNFLGALFGE